MFKSIRRLFSYAAAIFAIAHSRVVEVPTYYPQPTLVYTGDTKDFAFKPFFVHKSRGPGRVNSRLRRGFTAYISPDESNPRNLNLQITWCSHKDQFNKKEGRSYVVKQPITNMNKRDLPKYLNNCALECGMIADYNWILKYVV